MHSSQIRFPDGTTRTVKNLGWLVRHWREVVSFTIDAPRIDNCDCLLRAHMSDGAEYSTDFASSNLLKDWLHRPVFRGRPVTWNVAVPLYAQRDGGQDGFIPPGIRAA